jgi:hypothetical protein
VRFDRHWNQSGGSGQYFCAKTAAVIMCPNYESHNVGETRAGDFHANDGDFVDVILLYFLQMLYLNCLKFLRQSDSELQRSIMGRWVWMRSFFLFLSNFNQSFRMPTDFNKHVK